MFFIDIGHQEEPIMSKKTNAKKAPSASTQKTSASARVTAPTAVATITTVNVGSKQYTSNLGFNMAEAGVRSH